MIASLKGSAGMTRLCKCSKRSHNPVCILFCVQQLLPDVNLWTAIGVANVGYIEVYILFIQTLYHLKCLQIIIFIIYLL